jgi:hypothetical protein
LNFFSFFKNMAWLELDQYEFLWSRVQQYWTWLRLVQYCCTLLHKTSIFEILNFKFFFYLYVFQYYYLNIKILKFYENWNCIHWFCTRVQYGFLLDRNCFLLINK